MAPRLVRAGRQEPTERYRAAARTVSQRVSLSAVKMVRGRGLRGPQEYPVSPGYPFDTAARDDPVKPRG